MNKLQLIFICSMLLFSCHLENNKNLNTNSKSIDNIGYILKVPKAPKGLIVLFPKFYNDVNKTDSETKIDEKYYSKDYASL